MTNINFRTEFIIPDEGASLVTIVAAIAATALWLAEAFVSQPGVGPQRTERKIVRRFRQFDFVDVDGFRAVPQQDFLGQSFCLGRPDPHPDQQAMSFRKLFQSSCALAPQQPTRRTYCSGAYD